MKDLAMDATDSARLLMELGLAQDESKVKRLDR